MVVSAFLNSNILLEQTREIRKWISLSPAHNSTPETCQPPCPLNFEACDQRYPSPDQNGEENSCYSSEMGGENSSPPQENSGGSTSEELGPNLFPISGLSNTSNCNEYMNSDDKDSLHSSPPYFQDDDMYQTSKNCGGNNNNNKPKTYKCRNCSFTTTNKHESWKHTALHLKPEKTLRCHKCPFVTEYKHHLDFHIWNHEGKKPFKCDQCTYECVNKSMLKSHSKSHSSIYPFQCESCGYKTKYCHSMKIHLRRHQHHNPKTVLDEEGNPDPTLFIDIHSNRRGPKQKNKKSNGGQRQQRHQKQQQQQQLQKEQQLSQPLHLPSPPPPVPLTLALSQFNNYGVWQDKVFTGNENTPIRYPPIPPSMMAAAAAAVSLRSELPKGILSNHETDNLNNNGLMAVNQNSPDSSSASQHEDQDQKPLKLENEEIPMPDTCIEEKPVISLRAPFYLGSYEPLSLAITTTANSCLTKIPDLKEPEEAPLNLCPQVVETPLNLSLSNNSSNLIVAESGHGGDSRNTSGSSSSSSSSSSTSSSNGCMPAVKNRRKGVACKLKRTSCTKSSTSVNVKLEPIVQSTSSSVSTGGNFSMEMSMEKTVTESSEAGNEIAAGAINKSNTYNCEYCEITFHNQIMFTLHKGCHGFSDPFTCNRCGAKTDNKIDFYAHMISVAHL